MAKREQDRTIYTPTIETNLAETQDRLVYWKQILPEAPIQYTENGQVRTIDFNADYHRDCIKSFRDHAIDQTCFQIADSKNRHGRDFDPERQRAEVVDMATWDDLPDDVKEKVGSDKRGLYAKMRFFDKNAAKSVEQNPGLGVSARVRENFMRADGKFIKRAVIHVLGTIDPRVTGMSGWQAADLSYDPDNGYVLDLSNEHYEGNAAMAPKSKSKGNNTLDHIPSDDEIDAMTDEELDAFLAAGQAELDAETGEDDEPDDDELDDELDELDDEPDDDQGVGNSRTRETVGASLTNPQRRAIDLANAQAAQANQRANDALKRQAKAEFRGYRTELIAAGVRPADVDLCEPILTRANDMVVDLSNDDSDDINVTEIVRTLLESHRGDIDMSIEQGHSGTFDASSGENDPDQEMLDAWDAQFPV
jgi:hypothetical protein